MKDYDKNKELSYLKYWDTKDLYGWAISQMLSANYFKGPYIKYVGEGAGEFLWGSWNILDIYWWAMKYFSKFSMGHQIFSYVLYL